MKALVAIVIFGLFAACGGATPTPVGPVAQGGSPPVDNLGGAAGTLHASACQQAQWTLEALHCPEATTPHGTPFVVVCEQAMADGRDMHPGCIATIVYCSEVEKAYRGELCR